MNLCNSVEKIKEYFIALRNPKMASTALRVALIVGTVYFVINHGYAFMQNKMNTSRWISGFLSYAVPYCVNVHGQLISRRRATRNITSAHDSQDPNITIEQNINQQ